METQMLTQEQYKTLSRQLVKAMESRYRVIPLNSLGHSKYSLKAPIYISIEYEKDSVIASFDDIEAFGYADTEPEAIDQLREEITQIYEELKEDSINLGKLPQQWLLTLEDLIQCK